jgi:hypothetical protein
MVEKSDKTRDRAEAQFKKVTQATAAAEYRTDVLAMREKTARLRRLRLAKEAADSEAAAAEAAAMKAEPAPKPVAPRKRS